MWHSSENFQTFFKIRKDLKLILKHSTWENGLELKNSSPAYCGIERASKKSYESTGRPFHDWFKGFLLLSDIIELSSAYPELFKRLMRAPFTAKLFKCCWTFLSSTPILFSNLTAQRHTSLHLILYSSPLSKPPISGFHYLISDQPKEIRRLEALRLRS